MFKFIKRFYKSEEGAVTVDWVVLTSAIVVMGVLAVNAMRGETGGVSEKTSEYMQRQEPSSFADIIN